MIVMLQMGYTRIVERLAITLEARCQHADDAAVERPLEDAEARQHQQDADDEHGEAPSGRVEDEQSIPAAGHHVAVVEEGDEPGDDVHRSDEYQDDGGEEGPADPPRHLFLCTILHRSLPFQAARSRRSKVRV